MKTRQKFQQNTNELKITVTIFNTKICYLLFALFDNFI